MWLNVTKFKLIQFNFGSKKCNIEFIYVNRRNDPILSKKQKEILSDQWVNAFSDYFEVETSRIRLLPFLFPNIKIFIKCKIYHCWSTIFICFKDNSVHTHSTVTKKICPTHFSHIRKPLIATILLKSFSACHISFYYVWFFNCHSHLSIEDFLNNVFLILSWVRSDPCDRSTRVSCFRFYICNTLNPWLKETFCGLSKTQPTFLLDLYTQLLL